LANKIARKMTLVTAENVTRLKSEYQNAVTDSYMATIPKAVMEVFEKSPNYFNSCYSIKLIGNGWNYETVSSVGHIPSDDGGYPNFEPTKKISDSLKKMKHAHEDAKLAYEKLLSDTENALLSLRTFARIKENFPEAEKYLPPPMSNAVMINLDSIQDRLKKQPVTKITEKEKVEENSGGE